MIESKVIRADLSANIVIVIIIVIIIVLQVEFDDETGLPTDMLNPTARAVCNSMNVSAVTVKDIKTSNGGRKVLNMIQRAIDKANNSAASKQHKVSS